MAQTLGQYVKFRRRPGTLVDARQYLGSERALISTLEGLLEVAPGDWTVTGIRGKCYPVKPDIFAELYEPADELT
jgi:hypothetical protein